MTRHKILSTEADFLLDNYDYHLPDELIATRPVLGRHFSRLLVYKYKSKKIEHSTYTELPRFLKSPHHLVFNNSQVFKARLRGKKITGGEAEIFLLSLKSSEFGYPAMIKCSGKKNIGDQYFVGSECLVLNQVTHDEFFIKFPESLNVLDFLEKEGNLPIPPYIRDGVADEQDATDYQTVIAKVAGSVAAPTAALHFTHDLLSRLEAAGIGRTEITLHVGAGTFKPVKTSDIRDHHMHQEYFSLSSEALVNLEKTMNNWIAVGTTSLRALQSSFSEGRFTPPPANTWQATDIFLHPGKELYGIKGLITNFHLPKSSLIMLVSSLIGREETLKLYNLAVANQYRFFSYGDGMLILLDE